MGLRNVPWGRVLHPGRAGSEGGKPIVRPPAVALESNRGASAPLMQQEEIK
jgi:hypothetical protein